MPGATLSQEERVVLRRLPRGPGPMRPGWIRVRLGLGIGLVLAALFLTLFPTITEASPEHRLRVCFLSTTEEPSCATIEDSYSPSDSSP